MKDKNWQQFGLELRQITICGDTTKTKWENLCQDMKKKIEICFPERKYNREYKFTMSKGLLKSRDKKTAY